MTTELDAAGFRAHLDTAFLLDRGADRLPLRLVEVSEGRPGGGFVRFSLLFHGPGDAPLAQGSYAFQHDALGSLDMFIVPVIGSTAERMVYEACFSRRVEAGGAS
jgi:hypothetical protein